jgi:hypothetical protein
VVDLSVYLLPKMNGANGGGDDSDDDDDAERERELAARIWREACF